MIMVVMMVIMMTFGDDDDAEDHYVDAAAVDVKHDNLYDEEDG